MTTSTTICVSARSGAENQRNVRHVTRPAPPISVIATSRWNFAIAAAPTAHTMPMIQNSTNAFDAVMRSRSPHVSGTSAAARYASRIVVATIANICICRRRVVSPRSARRARRVSATRMLSNRRRPFHRSMSGTCCSRPFRCCARSHRNSATPPEIATRLITNGGVTPCHSARLYSGSTPPTTGRAAVASDGPIDTAGATPTTRQLTTSSSMGVRIHRGGSSGSRGRSVESGPKKMP